MDNDQVTEFANDPEALLGLVRTVALYLRSGAQPELAPGYIAQLEEIQGAISRLQTKGVLVPSSLIAERDNLRRTLQGIDENKAALAQLAIGLTQIVSELGDVKAAKAGTSFRYKSTGRKTARQPRVSEGRDSRPMTPAPTLRKYVLEYLHANGGRGGVNDVVDYVGQCLAGQLTEKDLEMRVSTNEVIWRNNLRWERQNMVQEGLLKRGSPKGIWELP